MEKKIFKGEDINLALQFEKYFREYYLGSLDRDTDGFVFEFKNKDKSFFKCSVWGEAYEQLKNPDSYANTVATLSWYFVQAFKAEYKIDEAA